MPDSTPDIDYLKDIYELTAHARRIGEKHAMEQYVRPVDIASAMIWARYGGGPRGVLELMVHALAGYQRLAQCKNTEELNTFLGHGFPVLESMVAEKDDPKTMFVAVQFQGDGSPAGNSGAN